MPRRGSPTSTEFAPAPEPFGRPARHDFDSVRASSPRRRGDQLGSPRLDHLDRGGQIISSPCRTPMVTASVRLRALSFTKVEAMGDLTGGSEIPSRAAMILLPSPPAIMPRTSISRGGKG